MALAVSSRFKRKEFNILLLGETGVGKSTFINAFINYISFETLDEAVNSVDIVSLIPCRFTVTDENFDEQTISHGEDANESTKVGAPATQTTRSYNVPIANAVIRIIDTPGIGDNRGIAKDEENFDELMTMIGELEELHTICILLKPNNARLTVLFEYCVIQLLSRLQKSASRNIVFIFTNSRSTFYRPGDTMMPLKKILNDIKNKPPHVDIPFGKPNVFCMDNEAFRFLVSKKHGVKFTEQEMRDFSMSWETSAAVCKSFVEFLVQAPPHKIMDTISVNEARRLISRLSEPLARVTENINKNITLMERHQLDVSDSNKSIDDLKRNLYVPVNTLKVTQLETGRTVCTDRTCTNTYKVVDGVENIHYKTICHNSCRVKRVKAGIVGNPSLYYCSKMDRNKNCTICGHHYLLHMYIYYITEPCTDKIINMNNQKNIEEKQNINEELKELISVIDARISQFTREKAIIQESMAKFAHFLKNNAIVASNDAYKDYIEYLIKREETFEPGANKKLIDSYKNLIKSYEEYKHILDRTLAEERLINADTIAVVSASDVLKVVQELYKLELTGKEIEEFYEKQKVIIKNELLTKTEKVYHLNAIRSNMKGIFNKIGSLFVSKQSIPNPTHQSLVPRSFNQM